jgi:hypothetical protein
MVRPPAITLVPGVTGGWFTAATMLAAIGPS